MAILVTGAAGLVGRAAVAALLRQGVEHVRAVVRDPAQVGDLRRLGAKVALLDATDPDGLAAAMDGVFTACSLTGSLWSRPARGPVRRRGRAGPGVPGRRQRRRGPPGGRLLPGRRRHPAPPSGNPHLAAKAEVERMVAASGLEHAILRCTHVLGPGAACSACSPPEQPDQGTLRRPGREPVLVPGDGRQRVAPVWVGDVADAIATADDAAELGGATWSLAGPTQLTFDELVDAVHGEPGRQAPPRRRRAVGPAPGSWAGLSEVQVGVLAADSLGDPALPAPPGLVPTSLAETLARSAGRERAGLPGRLDG